MQKNILILSYFVPPCNKVGGRRWAKFAKYLNRAGDGVFMLGVKVPFSGVCPWQEDIKSYEKNIRLLPYLVKKPFYQREMRPSSVFGKIRYRISKQVYEYKLKRYNGNYEDISKDYQPLLFKEASKIIEQSKITHLVVTGGPFYWLYYGTLLKKKYPQIRLLADFRDYFTGGESFLTLSESAKKGEAEKEQLIMELADVITSPAEKITQYLSAQYKNHAHKVNLLPHGFDADELPQQHVATSNAQSIQFIYGGILYEKMELAMKQFAQLLKCLIARGYQVNADIYTFGKKYSEVFEEFNVAHVVNYHATIPAKEFFIKCKQADFLLQFRAGEANEQHFKSTKFYELLALKKFIIYFGPAGEVSNYLVNNGLGFSYAGGAQELADSIHQAKEGRLTLNVDQTVDQYSFFNLTARLSQLLEI